MAISLCGLYGFQHFSFTGTLNKLNYIANTKNKRRSKIIHLADEIKT
jgi:hypothetical protein